MISLVLKGDAMNNAVFLDRDGTINEDLGYICSMDQFQLIPKTIEALQALQKHYQLFIITNQSGVTKGEFTEKELILFNSKIEDFLKEKEVSIQKTYYCPHLRSDNCHCIKPLPFFMQQASRDYNINLEYSFVVGDHPHDVEMGLNLGSKSIYVLTGHGEKHRDNLDVKPDFIAHDLWQASQWILKKE